MSYWYDCVLKNDFPSFVEKCLSTVDPSAEYIPGWYIDFIAEYLESARHNQINRLIINMPPRSLKSLCVNVAWPAWLLGHDPRSRILSASYASSLSLKHSLDCRMVVTSPWYQRIFSNVQLASDQNTKHKFMTTQKGFRLATSVGGSITGEGGNHLIIDDPLNPIRAMNFRWREFSNQWFDHSFASRLNNKQKGVIIVVMQRLHQHDLTWYLLNKGGWHHVSIPAIGTKVETYDFGRICHVRKANELLNQLRENTGLIERAKIELGSAAFSAQYQQQPILFEGTIIRPSWLLRYKSLPQIFERCVQSWDTAIKIGTNTDNSACLTFAETNGKSYLLDAKIFQHEYPDLKRMCYVMAEQWKPDAILVEDKSSGQQLLQDGCRETHFPFISIRPKFDKITRFIAVSAMCEAGRVMLPEQAAWLGGFEEEIFSFPNGLHDDQVDALTQYLDWLRYNDFTNLRIRKI